MSTTSELPEHDCAPVANRLTEHPVRVFWGVRYSAPIWTGAYRIQTPVGHSCGYCGEPIDEGSDGCLQAFIEMGSPIYLPVHLPCHARSVLGSPAHLSGTCIHGTGEEPEDPRSWWEQGVETLHLFLDAHGLFDTEPHFIEPPEGYASLNPVDVAPDD